MDEVSAHFRQCSVSGQRKGTNLMPCVTRARITILGYLTLQVAEAFEGVVDFGGALLPPLADELTRHRGIGFGSRFTTVQKWWVIEPRPTHGNVGDRLREEFECLIHC